MNKDLLTVPEVAQALNVTTSRVWQFIRARRLKVSAIYGRMLITRKEVERFQGIPRKSGRPWPKRKTRKRAKQQINEMPIGSLFLGEADACDTVGADCPEPEERS